MLGEVITRWKRSSGRIFNVRFLSELLGIDGEAIELEWNIFPGFTSLQILEERIPERFANTEH